MKLILCQSSALDFIRAHRWRWGKPFQPAQITSLSDCAHTVRGIQSITIPALDQTATQLEVLVPTTAMARRSETHICRVLKAQPMFGMFCKIDDHAYITSPEMTFLQMATRLSMIDLILLGMELCGTYAPCPYSERFDERPPVTTKERIEAFCKRAKGVRGATSAIKAARWLANGSNSPAETALMLYLCLPVHLGGYGFKYPDMNPTTKLGKRASNMFGYPTMRCDLHWVYEQVVVEYDSDQEHLSSLSASKDARRRNVLGYKDVRVITVRKPMIASPTEFDSMTKQLARALNRRLRPEVLARTKTRDDLRYALFPWLIHGWG